MRFTRAKGTCQSQTQCLPLNAPSSVALPHASHPARVHEGRGDNMKLTRRGEEWRLMSWHLLRPKHASSLRPPPPFLTHIKHICHWRWSGYRRWVTDLETKRCIKSTRRAAILGWWTNIIKMTPKHWSKYFRLKSGPVTLNLLRNIQNRYYYVAPPAVTVSTVATADGIPSQRWKANNSEPMSGDICPWVRTADRGLKPPLFYHADNWGSQKSNFLVARGCKICLIKAWLRHRKTST